MTDVVYTSPYPGGWRDLPDNSTPFTAEALQTFDDGIAAATTQANRGALSSHLVPSSVWEGALLLSYGNSYLAYTGNAEVIYMDHLRNRMIPWTFGNFGNAGMLAADACAFAYGTFTALRQGSSASSHTATTAAGTFGPSALLGGVVLVDVGRNDAGLDGTTASGGTTAKSRAGFANHLHAMLSLFRAGTKIENNATATRTATLTSGSPTVADATAVAGDFGKIVTGTGIPAGTFIGTVTPGTGYLLSSTCGSQTNVNATVSGSQTLTTGFVSRSGTWTTSASTSCSGGSFSVTSTHGDSVTYVLNVTAAAKAQWVALGLDDSAISQTGAAFTITVDGGAYTPTIATTSNQSRKTGHAPPNAGFGQLAIDLGRLTVGYHVVKVTHNDTTGRFLYDDCALISTATPPTVALLKIAQISNAGYAAAYPGVGASWTTDQVYNALIDAEVATYSNNEVVSIDPNTYVHPKLGAWNYSTMIGNDDSLLVHLNDNGNAFYVDCVTYTLNQLLTWRRGLGR